MQKTGKRIICWDSCIVIHSIEKQSNIHKRWLAPLLEAGRSDKLTIVTSAIAQTEVFYIKGENGGALKSQEATDVIDAFFLRKYVEVMSLDRSIGHLSAILRRDKGLSRW